MQRNIRLILLALILTFACSQLAWAAFPTISNKENKSSRPRFDIYTPQLSGARSGDAQSVINKSLNAVSEKMLADYRQATNYIYQESRDSERNANLMKALVLIVNYDVKLLNQNTFSIVQQGYMYSGGAHGMTTTIAKTFNLDTGREYKLADLFDNEDYEREISAIIRKEIVNRDKQNVYRFTGLQNNQAFFITKEGLFIYFQQYEIAPYSEGIITFFIPYSSLSGFKSEIIYGKIQ